MSKEYKFVIQEISYRHITVEADSYDAAKAEFVRAYEACEYENVREQVETELLTECRECGTLIYIDNADCSSSKPICLDCIRKQMARKGEQYI